jgi:2,4-dienoyl-CoA reductase-like NADH-dependent reductase (Old Yellow Enzyme family)
MTKLFEETEINGMRLANRLIRSATWEGMCEPDGRPTEKLISCYRNLALGGIGLIVSGYAYVRPEGKQLPGQMGIYTDAFHREYKKMTNAVHKTGGKIAMQLVHAGGQADPRSSGMPTLAPSAVKVPHYHTEPAELKKKEIKDIIEAFCESAARAREYGFDTVQLHGAHGYLINEFCSPHTNLRTDEYGGSIENRSRFILELYQRLRETLGKDYPILIKMNCADNMEGGLVIDEGKYIAVKLDEAGIDSIEVSSGNAASGKIGPLRMKIDSPEKEGWNLDYARRIKKAIKCPVMVVGGFRSYDICEKAIKEDGIDYITMCRPLIREPGLAGRWQRGDRSPARCVSCNGCFKPGVAEGGIYCVVDKKEQEKKAIR